MPAHFIAEGGPHRGLILNLEEGTEWIIGRDPDISDCILDDPSVSKKHAKITKTPEGIFIKNLSQNNPTLVNDEEFSKQHLLKEGDRIQIGRTKLMFSEEEIPLLDGEEEETDFDTEEDDDFDAEEDDDLDDEEQPPKDQYDEIFADLEKEEEPQESVYDTIFEDGEMEIPIDFAANTPFVLKVIAGPNAGAEIGIEKNKSYTIGKDPNSCDIVFQDFSVSRQHARLSVNDQGEIQIQDLGSKNRTFINSEPITETKAITTKDLVALGTTLFLIIDREGPQETIYSPVLPSQEKEEEALPEEAIEEEAVNQKSWKETPIPSKYLALGVSLSLVFLVVFLSFFSLFKSKGIEIAHTKPKDAIEKALTKFPSVQFSFNAASGKLFLVGHVLTAVSQSEMIYFLDQIEGITSIENTVVIDEYVSKSINDLLSSNPDWKGVAVRAVSPGKFVVTGYLEKNEGALNLSEYLATHFPYQEKLENRVIVEENLNNQLQAFLASQNLGAVTLELSGSEVILSGRYNEDMKSQLKDLIQELDQIHGISEVKNFAVPSSKEMAAIDLSENYQVTGSSLLDGKGFSVAINGKIYTLGDFIEGMKITTIQENIVLLEKDGLNYKINYTR